MEPRRAEKVPTFGRPAGIFLFQSEMDGRTTFSRGRQQMDQCVKNHTGAEFLIRAEMNAWLIN